MLERDLHPLSPRSVRRLDRFLNEYDEDVLSLDPPRVALTFTAAGDDLTLHVDESADIVDGSVEP